MVLWIGPEFAMPGSHVAGFGSRMTAPPVKAGLNSLRITVTESKRSMKLVRWMYQRSTDIDSVLLGDQMKPTVLLVDSSGFRFGFARMSVEMVRRQSSGSPPGA